MRIAIHHNLNGFSSRWIEYCKNNFIDYKLVNCYRSDIIDVLADCDALLWHFSHDDYRDLLFASQLVKSLEMGTKLVFPNSMTSMHFDDKLGQKYLLEQIGAPLVPTHIFYSKKDALEWVRCAEFPKVFKLRCGAGSANVRLVKSKFQAESLVRKAFGRGFSQFDRLGYCKDRVNKFIAGKDTFIGALKGVGRLFIGTEFARMRPCEKGYVYFQDFIPNNEFDIRIVVIEEKAFAIKRMVRKNDFRASGSGEILYEKSNFAPELLRLSFDIARKMKSQCVAFDFVFNQFNEPLLVEVSYGFSQAGYEKCIGYWRSDLIFVEGGFNPQEWMIENLIEQLKAKTYYPGAMI
jgi:glutathione synthase/RimK-type ligase-like ATP-grasp enzyme